MHQGAGHNGGSQSGGFTLLEVVFVLAMLAILVAWLTLSVGTVETEQKLREASGSIESFAKRARNIAVRQQRAYQLTISGDSISIAPEYRGAGDDEEASRDDDESEGRKKFEAITASEKTDKEITYEIKRWRSDEWELIDGEKKVVLTLEPTGLVEPVSIRCSIGKSWLVHELHPLTAGVRDEEMHVEED